MENVKEFKINESQIMMEEAINESNLSIVPNAIKQINEMTESNLDILNDSIIFQFN